MTGGEAFVAALREAGVRYLFGLPGSTEAAILDALAKEDQVQYILTLHENVAVGMADGYARATGSVSVVNLHTSVGTFNGLTAIYNAWRDASAVVVTVGHKDSRLLSRDGFCVLPDLADVPRQFTKWSWQTVDARQIVPDLYRAIKVAGTAPRGPVFLAIPEDLLAAALDDNMPGAPGLTKARDAVVPDPASLVEVAKLLVSASRVVLVAGSEVAVSRAQGELAKLAEVLGAPVVHEPRRSATAIGFPQDHPHYMGFYDLANPVVREAEVIFFVGGKVFLEFDYPALPEVPATAKIIHLHPSAWEVAKLYATDFPLVGDIRETLRSLLEAFEGLDLPLGDRSQCSMWWRQARERAHSANDSAGLDEGGCISSDFLAQQMRNVFSPSTIIVDEAIRTSRALLANYRFTQPDTYYHSGGGGLGWGIPAALGISLARPGQKVVALVGDGSALFTIQGLWTAAHYRIPVLFIVCNNRGYRAVYLALREYRGKTKQEGKFVGTTIDEPPVDFVLLARGFGVEGERVMDASALGEALARGLAADGPYLLDVLVE